MTEHGKNIDPFTEISLEVDDLYEQISGITAIENEEQHEAVTQLFEDLHEAGKKAEALRKDEVKPLDEAREAIQAKFHPLIGDTKKGKGKVIRGKEVLQEILGPWRKKVADEKAAAARKAQEEAEAERLAAIEAMRASSGDIEAREQAEQLVSAAEQAERFAKKANKVATTGLGLRIVWVAEMVNPREAVSAMVKAHPQEFIELAQKLASSDAHRGARKIPGFRVYAEGRAT